MAAIYRWNGEYFGFISGDWLFDATGNYVGWITGDAVRKADGSYLGELVDGEYILRSVTMAIPARVGRRAPPGRPPAPGRPGRREARARRPGYVDALDDFW